MTPDFKDFVGNKRRLNIVIFIYVFKIFLMFIFERDRQMDRFSGGGAEREGDTDSEAGSRL